MRRRLISFGLTCRAMPGLLLVLCGCQPPTGLNPISLTSQLTPQPANAPNPVTSAFLAPAGDYAMVITRARPDRPQSSENRAILCTAPSPDWATALAAAQAVQASGGKTGGPSASLSANSSLSETVTAMLGRSAGVVALRDGLYKACEAYANGVIGKDAYALVLSQYGNLLVSLAGSAGGGSSGAGSSGAPATTTPAGVAVAVSGGTPTASNASPPAAAAGASAANATVAQMQEEVLQAMLVTCVNEFDVTVRPPDQQNPALLIPCTALINAVVGKALALLTPTAAATNTPKPAAVVAKTTPNPGILELQQKLKTKCNAEISPDGVYGPQTAEALLENAGKPCLS